MRSEIRARRQRERVSGRQHPAPAKENCVRVVVGKSVDVIDEVTADVPRRDRRATREVPAQANAPDLQGSALTVHEVFRDPVVAARHRGSRTEPPRKGRHDLDTLGVPALSQETGVEVDVARRAAAVVPG